MAKIWKIFSLGNSLSFEQALLTTHWIGGVERKDCWDVSDLNAVLAKTSCLFQLWDANQGQPIRAQWMLNTLKLTLSFCKTDCQTSSTTIYVIDSWYNMLEMCFLSKATKQIKFEKKRFERFFKLHFVQLQYFFQLRCCEKEKIRTKTFHTFQALTEFF